MSKKAVKISVVIPTYNSWETLKSSIESVGKQTLKPSEIVVIDNASTDKTSSNVKKHFPKAKLVKMKKNTGVTGGRNTGIKAADKTAEYIFFFDHDMVAENNLLEELVRVAESDKKIGIVTPKIFYWQDRKRIWAAGTGMNLWTGQVLFRGGHDEGQYEEVCEVQVAPAAMLVKKELIKEIKGFDDRYFAIYEDTDFCFRAKRLGYKTFYVPKSVAYHNLSTDIKDEADRLLSRSYWVGRNRILFMKDFGIFFPVFLFFIPLYSIYYLRMAIKYKRLKDGFEYIHGTINGLLEK